MPAYGGFTCVDAVQKSSRHDHLEGRRSAAQQHQHGSGDGNKVVQQKASLPARRRGAEGPRQNGEPQSVNV